MKKLLLFSAIFLFSCQPADNDFDVLIVGGRIIDGTGNPWFLADVGIHGDRITAIGNLKGKRSKKTIDAAGKIVSPGFIDMLGQSELSLLVDNRAMSKISQGVTTEVTGEGESVAPLNDRTLKELRPFVEKYKVNIDWKNLEGYFRRLEEHKSAINLATFVGATQVREYVIGFDDRSPTPEELDQMKRLVRDAMEQGALGVSTSLVYAPAIYAKTQELIELCKVAAEYGGIYCTHIRDERDNVTQSLYEAADIAREAKLPVEVWHLKVAGKQNWEKMGDIARLIDLQRKEGIDMTADIYPYTASATSLSATIPAWVHDGGSAKLLERLKDPTIRKKIREELEGNTKGQENFYRGTGPDGIMIGTVMNPELKQYEGKRLNEIAAAWKKHPLETLFDFLLADSARSGAIYFSMYEQDVRMAMAQPWVSFNTDYGEAALDGPLSEGKPHPRTFGTFARVLGKYVREEKILTLEEAIRKMTSLPAQRVGLKGRGLLKEGFFGDVVIFDPNTVSDKATFEKPHQYSVGIHAVLVNGQPVWENGAFAGNLPGMVLRGPGWRK
ncbi:MAG: D-aminoacylase [Bacteroidota bacterium]